MYFPWLFIMWLYVQSEAYCNTITNYGPEVNSNAIDAPAEKSYNWLKSAQNMISSPAGHIVIHMAKELLSRSVGNTQVLSLNVTNLIILLLLKILIVTAALLGSGHWRSHGHDYGRSAVPSISLNDAEADLITGFLAAQAGYDDCLYAAACTNPHMAKEYVRAAKALIGGVETFEGLHLNNPRYYDLIQVVEQAAQNGYYQKPCNVLNMCELLFQSNIK